AARQRRGDPLDRHDGVAWDRPAGVRGRRADRREARAGGAARAGAGARARRPLVAAYGRAPAGMSLLLGIDEGTSAVKAMVLDRLEREGRADEVRERSGMPLDPYFSAGKLAWLLENDSAVAAARDAGTLRLGTVDAFLCQRLGAGFHTDPSTVSRTQLGAPG